MRPQPIHRAPMRARDRDVPAGAGADHGTMLATVPGTVWMTEVGGLYSYGRSFPPSTSRQVGAVRWMTRLAASSPGVRRLYYYSFDGGGTFDAGLLWPDGTARPAYTVFADWADALRRGGSGHGPGPRSSTGSLRLY